MARSNLLSGLLYGKSSWILHKFINTVKKVSTKNIFALEGKIIL